MHSVPDPCGVRFTGLVAPFAAGLVEELASLGYARTTATNQMQLAASLSRWLLAAGISLDGLTDPVMERFVSERRARHANRYSLQGLTPIVGYLRRVGAVPAPVAPIVAGAPWRRCWRGSRCIWLISGR